MVRVVIARLRICRCWSCSEARRLAITMAASGTPFGGEAPVASQLGLDALTLNGDVLRETVSTLDPVFNIINTEKALISGLRVDGNVAVPSSLFVNRDGSRATEFKGEELTGLANSITMLRVLNQVHVNKFLACEDKVKELQQQLEQERNSKRVLQVALDAKAEQLRVVMEQRDQLAFELKGLKAELARATTELQRSNARLWCGAIISQLNEHARNYIFTREKVIRERLYKEYDDVYAIRRHAKLGPDEKDRLHEVETVIKQINSQLLGGADFDRLSWKWAESRKGDAHPTQLVLADGTKAAPTDDLLVPFIVECLSDQPPFAERRIFEQNVRAVLQGFHKVAKLAGADDAPFDLD